MIMIEEVAITPLAITLIVTCKFIYLIGLEELQWRKQTLFVILSSLPGVCL